VPWDREKDLAADPNKYMIDSGCYVSIMFIIIVLLIDFILNLCVVIFFFNSRLSFRFKKMLSDSNALNSRFASAGYS
jgi:hypothetical protein